MLVPACCRRLSLNGDTKSAPSSVSIIRRPPACTRLCRLCRSRFTSRHSRVDLLGCFRVLSVVDLGSASCRPSCRVMCETRCVISSRRSAHRALNSISRALLRYHLLFAALTSFITHDETWLPASRASTTASCVASRSSMDGLTGSAPGRRPRSSLARPRGTRAARRGTSKSHPSSQRRFDGISLPCRRLRRCRAPLFGLRATALPPFDQRLLRVEIDDGYTLRFLCALARPARLLASICPFPPWC